MSIEATERDGVPLRIARPEGRPASAVVVLHQAGGWSPQIEQWLTLLAGQGHLAIAPLLLHRHGVESVDPVARFGGDLAAFGAFLPGDDEVRGDVDRALAHVQDQDVAPAATGVLGFSFGGRAAYLLATERPLGAAVTYYGNGVQRPSFEGNDGIPALTGRVAMLQTPWLGLYGEQDFLLSPGELDDLERDLAAAPVPAQLVRYPAAGHAFDVQEAFGPGMPVPYVAAAAEDARTRTLQFLHSTLH